MRFIMLVLLGCTPLPDTNREVSDPVTSPTLPGTTTPTYSSPTTTSVEEVWVIDEGLSSGYQDNWFDTWKRGRGNIVADYDGDGDYDVFNGNPANQSFLIVNITEGPGAPLMFEAGQVLSESELFYGGVAADFDNDGDPDLAISAGANDGAEFDRMYRNDINLGADPAQPLTDVTQNMALYPTDLEGDAMPNQTMGMRAFDADNDGNLDLWASNEVKTFDELMTLTVEDVIGLNQLYINRGGFVMEDRAWDLGIQTQAGSRHAAILDFDRDGDFDIYDNAFSGPSTFYRNMLMEEGELSFDDVSDVISMDGANLRAPFENQSMCSLATDLDNDGWQDLLLLHRGLEVPIPVGAVLRHQVLMNQQGLGFIDVGEHTNLSHGWWDHPDATETGAMAWWGVMGCQVGDVNLDGFPDVFLGNGGGGAGEVNRLFVSSRREIVDLGELGEVVVPMFDDWTELIDFVPPSDPEDEIPPYPLRTHGTAFVDFDGDGVDELAVHNGGPASREFEEPNRLYRFYLPDPRFLRIHVEGDGDLVNRDGVGTTVRVTVERDRDGATWDLWKVLYAGEGFGAQNAPELVFGLGDADRVLEIEVLWPDGLTEMVTPPAGTQQWLTVTR